MQLLYFLLLFTLYIVFFLRSIRCSEI